MPRFSNLEGLMRELGYCLLAAGAVWLLIAFNMDTSVATYGSSLGPSRVENIGLIARRENHLYIAGLLIIVGTLLALFGRKGGEQEHSGNPDRGHKPRPERNLKADSYRLWLADKYEIKKNDVFGGFVIQESIFATLDEALRFADQQEADELEAAKASSMVRENEASVEPIESYTPLIVLAVMIGFAVIYLAGAA